ncbi:MAG: hypothetical protein ACKOWW_03610 [Flavobacteriales bacterium]
MIDELKMELEKTFNRKIADRGDCEALVQDIYEKTGAVLSYNTLRRLFGLAEYRKPRESTLDQLSIYCGFSSFKDFSTRYTDVDIWPTWESLYVSLAQDDIQQIVSLLKYRKAKQEYFTMSFAVCLRELISRREFSKIIELLQEPAFQFSQLPYDEVAQIGVLVGLHFRHFDDEQLERQLLLVPNFRDFVFKIFVDYARLNQKYGRWISFLSAQKKLDNETQIFITALEIWRQLLMCEVPDPKLLKKLPIPTADMHPILFGRVFGIKMINAKTNQQRDHLKELMTKRLEKEPQYITELLYEPAVQSLVLRHKELKLFVAQHNHLVNDIKFWYHFSQVSIHRIFEVAWLLEKQDFTKAKSILEHIPFGHIRHGYREFLELYIGFFRMKINQGLGLKDPETQKSFLLQKQALNYPLFDDAYFKNYFA